MSILNYFFIGFAFSFLIDVFIYFMQNHPKVKELIIKGNRWGLKEITICALIWPISMLIFLFAFFKAVFRK